MRKEKKRDEKKKTDENTVANFARYTATLRENLVFVDEMK